MARALLFVGLTLLGMACTRAPEQTPGPPVPAVASPAPASGPEMGAPSPPQPVIAATWSVRTADGAVELGQFGRPPEPCQLEARRAGQVIWTANRCVARVGQAMFLGPDGETVIAVERFVPRGDGADGTGPVVAVSRRGEPVRTFRAAELAPLERYLFSDGWLASADRGAESAPRLGDAGDAVRLVTARATVVTIRFDGVGWPENPERAAATAVRRGEPDPTDDATMFRWEDARGDVHYTVASEVPSDRARTARRVNAQIGTVAVDRVGGIASDPRFPTGSPLPRAAAVAPASLPPAGPARSAPRSTFFVDTYNKTVGPNGGSPVDAEALDRQYQKQAKDMKCRTVDGVVICG